MESIDPPFKIFAREGDLCGRGGDPVGCCGSDGATGSAWFVGGRLLGCGWYWLFLRRSAYDAGGVYMVGW